MELNGEPNTEQTIERRLSLLDCVSIIVGIIVGAGIFETAPSVAQSTSTLQGLMLVWLFGGLLSLAGALCYAELATTYPEQGGDIVYLERAYGPWAGFLFGWAHALVIRPGSIAAIAFAFARYAILFTGLGSGDEPHLRMAFAIGATVILTILNVLGVRESAGAQNLLSGAKVIGLCAVVIAALFAEPAADLFARSGSTTSPALGLILVLFTFGGWNDIAYVAAEVREPARNLFWALVLGTAGVTVLYLFVNLGYVYGLGMTAVASSTAVATDTVAVSFPVAAPAIVAFLVCLCTFGGTNGTIFTGARMYYALGKRVECLAALGSWHESFGTPATALVVQCLITIPIILLTGSFNASVIYTTTVMWLFFLATGIAIFVLRWREPHRHRPNPVLLHPLTTILFCCACLLLIWGAVSYDWKGSLLSIGLLLSGVPVYRLLGSTPPANTYSTD